VTVRAATALRVLVIDRKNFQELLREVPELTQRLLVTLSRRIRSLETSERA
jgi:CRP-like cAMP-binding protein